MFVARSEFMILEEVGAVVIAMVVWDPFLSLVIEDSIAVVIKASDTLIVMGPSVTAPA